MNKSRASHFIKAGMPVRPDGFLDTGACLDWMAVNTRVAPEKIAAAREQLLGPRSFPGVRPWTEQEVTESGQSRDDFLTVAEAEEQAREQGARIREGVRAIPGRIAEKLAAETDAEKVKSLITGEIDRFLNELADTFRPGA